MKRADPGATAARWDAKTRPTRVALRWRVGDIAAERVLGAGSGSHVELELTEAEPGRWRAESTLKTDGSEPRPIRSDRTEARCVLDRGRGLLHVDAGATLRATFELLEDGALVLYALTPLLAELGLGGGRYQIAGGEVDFAGNGTVGPGARPNGGPNGGPTG